MNKRKKGIVGVTVLWMLAALSAMAVTALAAGKISDLRGRSMLDETRMNALAQAGCVMAREGHFSMVEFNHTFETGEVRVSRLSSLQEKELKIKVEVKCGRSTKSIESGWARSGSGWLATYWREL